MNIRHPTPPLDPGEQRQGSNAYLHKSRIRNKIDIEIRLDFFSFIIGYLLGQVTCGSCIIDQRGLSQWWIVHILNNTTCITILYHHSSVFHTLTIACSGSNMVSRVATAESMDALAMTCVLMLAPRA